MKKQERYEKVFTWFAENRPVVKTELEHSNPYQLVVAVILSAQCTDKRVNIITPEFFKVFPTVEALANSRPEVVFEYIKSCSYPNNKSKHLVNMAKTLVSEYNGNLPEEPAELQKLPGIGRKSANVIASILFQKLVIAVDTHVFRTAARIGLVHNAKTPLETENQLMNNTPSEYLPNAHHWLVLHGRYVCTARKPKCLECGINRYCKYFEKQESIQTDSN